MELARPEIVHCVFLDSVVLFLSAMELRWDPDAAGDAERRWYLPEGVCLTGPAPQRFGLTIHRRGLDAYQVRILWNRLSLHWESLSRAQIMSSSLAIVLSALGIDLWHLLNQPIEHGVGSQVA